VRFPPTALHAVVVQQKNTRSPASGSGCDSRPPLRSNAAGTTLATLRKKPGGSNPPGSESSRSLCDPCRPLSTAANAGGVTFLKRRTSSPLVAALFPAVNADGTTMTCPRVGIPLCRALLGGGQKRAAGNVSSFLSPPFFLALRSSVEAGPHKPVCEGSTPSAATTRSPRRATKRSEVNVPESSNGRTRGFDPRDEGPNPSSGTHLGVAQPG
jgi:hypothetical protein